MVSLLGVNMVLLQFLLGAVPWFWGRVPGSLAEGYIVLLSDLCRKKPDCVCRQNFMDSVVNGRYFRQPVQMSSISFSLQCCVASTAGRL